MSPHSTPATTEVTEQLKSNKVIIHDNFPAIFHLDQLSDEERQREAEEARENKGKSHTLMF